MLPADVTQGVHAFIATPRIRATIAALSSTWRLGLGMQLSEENGFAATLAPSLHGPAAAFRLFLCTPAAMARIGEVSVQTLWNATTEDYVAFDIGTCQRLCRSKGIEKLTFLQQPCDDALASCLVGLSNLQSVVFTSAAHITDGALPFLAAIPTLQHVELHNTGVTDVAPLASLPLLATLAVTNTSLLSDAGVRAVASMQQLRSVDFSGTQITDAAVAFLAAIKLLEHVELSGTSVSDLTPLASLPLKTLTVARTPSLTDTGVRSVPTLVQLRSVNVNSSDITERAIPSLTAPPCLEHLDISGCTAIADFTSITSFYSTTQRLLSLHVSFLASFDNAATAKLKGLKFLRRLVADNTGITNAGVRHLASIPTLEHISLSGCAITDPAVKTLVALPALQHLDLSDCEELTDAALKHASKIPTLRQLSVSNTTTTDEGIAHLVSLRHLERLDLGMSEITDDGVEYFLSMPALEHLSLAGCGELSSVEPLAAHPRLKALEVEGCCEEVCNEAAELKGVEVI